MRRWRMVSTDRSGAQTKYPAALQRYKLDTPLLAAGICFPLATIQGWQADTL